jgi:hypothetical protein
MSRERGAKKENRAVNKNRYRSAITLLFAICSLLFDYGYASLKNEI